MTNEEAIKRLKEARTTIQPFRYVDEAIDYAIQALESHLDRYDKGFKDGIKYAMEHTELE